ncbi:unnamed protein product [Rotaria sp. Silwood2]|nr:unnamed protein product [Rotaria sp. Silwood2]
MHKSKQKQKALQERVDSSDQPTVIMLDAIDKNHQGRMAQKDINMENDHVVTLREDHEAQCERKVMHDDSKVGSEVSYVSDAQKASLTEEQPDKNQRVEVMKDGRVVIDQQISGRCQVVGDLAVHQNQQIPNEMNEIDTDFSPIVGYAEEPLLPLPEACAPLINILHDLSVYVQLALDETPESPSDGLTVDESAAIRLYTIEWEGPHRSLYSMLNYTLKNANREELRPYFKYMKLFLTALVKLPCVPPLTVWRGVTKNLSAEFPPGTPVTWWSFSSCTISLSVLKNNMYLGDTGARTLFSVEAINGRTIRAHSHFVTEEEILLLPGTHMIVQSQLSPASDLYIIHLKQVIPEQTLLEPPFEGNFQDFRFIF